MLRAMKSLLLALSLLSFSIACSTNGNSTKSTAENDSGTVQSSLQAFLPWAVPPAISIATDSKLGPCVPCKVNPKIIFCNLDLDSSGSWSNKAPVALTWTSLSASSSGTCNQFGNKDEGFQFSSPQNGYDAIAFACAWSASGQYAGGWNVNGNIATCISHN